jgi:hypothetical protein
MEGEFELGDSFYCDNGELDGLTPAQCFVLGVEWDHIVKSVERHEQELNFTVHSDNRERLEKAIEKRDRKCEWQWPHDDVSEEWVYLKVYPADK